MKMDLIIDLVLPIAITVLILYWYIVFQRNKKYLQNLPIPPTVPLLGNALDFKSTDIILDNMLKYVKEYGGIVKMQIGPIKTGLIVADYKMLEFTLSSTSLLTKSEDYQFFKSWLGSGLLIGSGPKWKKHRKILTPAFHFQILKHFVDTFESCGDNLIQKLLKETDKDSVDIYPYITLCTLDVICESTMGISINAQENDQSDYVLSVKEMCRILIERSVSPIQMFDLLFYFTRNYRIQKKSIQILHAKANSVIDKRLKEIGNAESQEDIASDRKKVFLDILIEATVDGRPLTHQEIREEVDTFMFAGHDTTASAISFTLFCLANNPEVQSLVYEEQQAIFEGNKNPRVTYAHIQSMKYLENVIKEALRLYPSVPIIGRQPDDDLHYENTYIPKKTTLLLFIFGIHRNPEYFKDPEKFDPSRFDNLEGKHPYAYIPFSAGPRNCIGQKFAMLEMKSVLSKIIRNFELRPSIPEHKLQLVAETVLKSSSGIKINLKSRS